MTDGTPAPVRPDRQAFPAINPADGPVMDVYITMRRAEWVARRRSRVEADLQHA